MNMRGVAKLLRYLNLCCDQMGWLVAFSFRRDDTSLVVRIENIPPCFWPDFFENIGGT